MAPLGRPRRRGRGRRQELAEKSRAQLEREKIAERKAAGKGARPKQDAAAWRSLPVEGRLSHSLVKGIADFIDAAVEAARVKLPSSAGA